MTQKDMQKSARKKKLAKALKANLKRRKQAAKPEQPKAKADQN